MTNTTVDADVTTKNKVDIKPPSLYDVVFYNDQRTTYEFVVLVLMHIFGKSYDDAIELTSVIHTKGREAVATYTHEIASAKRDETTSVARTNGHPLRVEIEPSTQP